MDTTTPQTPQNEQKTDAKSAPAALGPATAQDFAATLGEPVARKESASSQNEDAAAKHRTSVNDGRLRKKQEELDAANARIAELEAQVAKATAAKPAFDADAVKKLAKNPDEIGDDFAETQAAGLNAVRERIRDEFKGELDAMREEFRTERERAGAERTQANLGKAMQAVEAQTPGLVARIARGDLRDKWESFLDGEDPWTGRPYRETLQRAVADGRTEAASGVYGRFVRDAGLSGQYGGTVEAPPRGAAPALPRALGMDGKPFYESRDQIRQLYERAVMDASAGRISQEAKQKKLEELKSALEEKRYAK